MILGAAWGECAWTARDLVGRWFSVVQGGPVQVTMLPSRDEVCGIRVVPLIIERNGQWRIS